MFLMIHLLSVTTWLLDNVVSVQKSTTVFGDRTVALRPTGRVRGETGSGGTSSRVLTFSYIGGPLPLSLCAINEITYSELDSVKKIYSYS